MPRAGHSLRQDRMYFEFHHEQRQAWAPSVDVCERPDEFVIFVEMPGVDRDDVKLSWHDGILIISGIKRQLPEATGRFHRVERSHGQFRREITIHLPVDHGRARAELHDGLMRIYLPKRTSRIETGEIPIT